MQTFTIQDSKNYEIAPGNYIGKFQGMTPIDTANGAAYRWEFLTEKGQTISGLSDAKKPPTTKNKTGRWLCGLANKPVAANTQINPDEFVGKNYIIIVVSSEKGGKLETFSAMAN